MASITGAAARKACGSPSANTRDGRHTEGAGSATLGALVWGWLAGLPGYRPAEDYKSMLKICWRITCLGTVSLGEREPPSDPGR